jgi:predicted CoA-substrate-specific enzyme activase
MIISVGIDIGSAFSKGIALKDGDIVASFETPSGGDFKLTAERIRENLLLKIGQDLNRKVKIHIVATGFGSKMVGFADEIKTEIICIAKSVSNLLPSVRTVVDVGDLYTKVLRMDNQGNINNFILSGKCAGGSGRILQIISKVLQVKLDDIGELSLRSKKRVDFSTGCAVFSESEAISRIAEGARKEDLLAGLHRSLASQINSLIERVGPEMDMAMVGGGAKDIGLVEALKEIRGHKILVPSMPQMIGALGAALIAKDFFMRSSE